MKTKLLFIGIVLSLFLFGCVKDNDLPKGYETVEAIQLNETIYLLNELESKKQEINNLKIELNKEKEIKEEYKTTLYKVLEKENAQIEVKQEEEIYTVNVSLGWLKGFIVNPDNNNLVD